MAYLGNINRINKQANNNGGGREQYIIQEAGRRGQPTPLAIFCQISACKHPNGCSYQSAHQGHHQATKMAFNNPPLPPGGGVGCVNKTQENAVAALYSKVMMIQKSQNNPNNKAKKDTVSIKRLISWRRR